MSWATVAYGVMAAVTAYGIEENRKQASRSLDQAKRAAVITARQADEANNRANAKSPDTAAAIAAAMLSGKGGQSSTMLTGPGGVDPAQLTLGKSSLLGGG